MRKNLTLREKVLLGTVGGAIVALALYWLVLQPQYQAFTAARDRLTKLEQQLATTKALAAREAVERQSLDDVQQRLAALKPLFQTNVEDGSVLADIGLEAIRRGVAITAFKPGTPVDREHYLEIPLAFTVEGNYPAIQAFLSKIENLANVSEIRRLDIQAGSLEGNTQDRNLPSVSNGYVRAQFTAVIYATPEPGAEQELAELGQWLVGRFNPFLAARSVSPLPGKVPVVSPMVPGQPGSGQQESVTTPAPVPPLPAGAGEPQIPK